MKRPNLKYILYFAIATVVCVGCKSKQIAHQPTLPTKTAETTIAEIKQNQPDFVSFNLSKMDMGVEWKNHKFTLKGSIKLQKDSLLSISIQPFLGVEAFRAEFTPNQFVIIDKMNRKYTENNYDFLKYKFGIPIDFFTLQSMISNRFFILGDSITESQFAVLPLQGDTMTIRCEEPTISQQFKIAKDNQIVEASLSKGNASFAATYTEHARQDNILFPQHAEAKIGWNDEILYIQIDINKITFNQPLYFPGFAKSKYQKVSFSDILP